VSQKQTHAQNITGGSSILNIHGSSAKSIFNDLVRTPLEAFLKMSLQKEIIILIDGLDESIKSSKEEDYSDSIISILSNLEGLKNVYFIMTTRDHEEILHKFNKNSLVLDISSNKYINYINSDVSSFIKLTINKKQFSQKYQEKFIENMINQLIEKTEGNFLYIKFVMDAIVEGKISFSEKEINKIPSGLFGMYTNFFDRLVSQYGAYDWKTSYVPIIRTLLVSFEGLDFNQISFFTGIEDNLQEILIDLKPFIVLQRLHQSVGKSSSVKYKLYHQSLVEFLKKQYFDDNSLSRFYISEQIGHKKIVEKYYDRSKEQFKINLLKEYGLRYLPDHLFALFDYDDPQGIDWYAKLLELAKDKEFEEKQRQYFPFEANLPLKTIKRAYDASLEKDDPVLTAELLLIYANNLKKIFLESPLSILNNTNLDNNDILEKSWRIADLYDKGTRVNWYFLIAWYLDCKDKKANAQKTLKTLDRLLGKALVNSDLKITRFFVYSLYDRYKEKMVKILNHISNEHIYEISSFFFKNNNIKVGLEIFSYVRNKKAKINNEINELNTNKLDTENLLITELIEKCNSLDRYYRSEALSSIAQSLAQSNKVDDAIKIANAIEDRDNKSEALSSIAQSLAQFNKLDDAIKIANTIERSYDRSRTLSSIAQSLAQSNKVDEAAKLFDEVIKAANSIEDRDNKSEALSSIDQSLAQSNKLDEAAEVFDDAIKIANSIVDRASSSSVKSQDTCAISIFSSNSFLALFT
jgi:PPR repeat